MNRWMKGIFYYSYLSAMKDFCFQVWQTKIIPDKGPFLISRPWQRTKKSQHNIKTTTWRYQRVNDSKETLVGLAGSLGGQTKLVHMYKLSSHLHDLQPGAKHSWQQHMHHSAEASVPMEKASHQSLGNRKRDIGKLGNHNHWRKLGKSRKS